MLVVCDLKTHLLLVAKANNTEKIHESVFDITKFQPNNLLAKKNVIKFTTVVIPPKNK
mgnify:CR=1 FL=1